MMRVAFPFYLMFVAAVCASVAQADQTATTNDGRAVLLRADGTWIYVEALEPTGFQFRGTRWGMTPKEVRRSEEGKPVTKNDQSLFYEGTAAGLPCRIFFAFAEGRLVRAGYEFTPAHENQNDYLDDYRRLAGVLAAKYGPPAREQDEWTSDLYRKDPRDHGLAVAVGHRRLLSAWTTPDTEITLSLTGGDSKIRLAAEYRSRAFAPLDERTTEKKTLDEF